MAQPAPSDSDLIRKFLGGHSAAFNALVRRYEESLLGFLARMTQDRTLAEDLFQETFVRIMHALPDYRDTGRFRSWLFSVARNLALDSLRRRSFEQSVFTTSTPNASDSGSATPLEGVADARSSPESHTERREMSAHIEKAIAQLPPEQREVIVLRYVVGMTFREIAELTNCSINTVIGRSRYASKALRALLGEFAPQGGE